MPISRATARSDRPPAPSVASWPRAPSVISRVSSARTRSRAVRLAFTRPILTERRHEKRALLLQLSPDCPPRPRPACRPAGGGRHANPPDHLHSVGNYEKAPRYCLLSPAPVAGFERGLFTGLGSQA